MTRESYFRRVHFYPTTSTLQDVADWVAALTSTAAFIDRAQQFSDLHRQLHGEQDREKRAYLLAQLYPPAA